jgi:proteasome lid subunit RPN8/RPN11
MLVILSELVNAMIAQAREDHPLETCGVIAGPQGSNLPLRLIPMRNIANSKSFFKFDAEEQFAVWKEMEERDEESVVLYHSHTQSRAYPSHDDVAFAVEPKAHYVIVSTDPARNLEIRSFRIIDGKIAEEKLKSVGGYAGQLAAQTHSIITRSPACQLS